MKIFEENELAIQRLKTEKRVNNIKRFRYQFSEECKDLTSKQILIIFLMYKKHCKRTFQPTNITMVVAGTLIILITSLFMNGGANGDLSRIYEENMPNAIVMNTVISSATSGLTLIIVNQYSNIMYKESII
jgi:ammonia channel protein AmtB